MNTPPLTLNNSHTIPTLGLGTWNSPAGTVAAAVKYALTEVGYTHIDCAAIYLNEKEIGTAFAEVFEKGKIKREDIFITSKLWNTDHHPDMVEAACRQTLDDLQLEYLDLYLIHWGVPFAHGEDLEPLDENGIVRMINVPIYETWRAMEQLVEKGLVRSIGVANFTTMMLLDLLNYAHIKPVTNQIELHPYNTQTDLINFCQHQKVSVTAYSPLGSPGVAKEGEPIVLKDSVIVKIAKSLKKTPAQVLLRWALQRGTIPIPKSTTPERIAENSAVFDFELSEDDMQKITGLNKNHRFVNPGKWWGIPYFC